MKLLSRKHNICCHVLLLILMLFFTTVTQLMAGTLSGTISLPSGVSPSSSSQTISVVVLKTWNQNGWYFQSSDSCGSFTLPANSLDTPFSCSVNDTTGDVGLMFYSSSTRTWSYYNSNGTVLDEFNAERLSANQDRENLEFKLLKTVVVHGFIRTPGGVTFDDDYQLIIYTDRKVTNPNGYSYWPRNNWYYTLGSGENEIEYFSYVHEIAEQYRTYYSWHGQPTPEGYVQKGYYNSSATKYSEDDAELLSTSNPGENIDMVLLQGLPLPVTVQLPTTEVNSQNMTINLKANGDNGNELGNNTITLEAGELSTQHTFYFPPGENVRIQYSDIQGADRIYMSPGYFSYEGTSTDYWSSPLLSTDFLPPAIELTILPGYLLTGTISLPDSLTYRQAVSGEIYFGGANNYWGSGNFSIEPETNSYVWSTIVPTGLTNVALYTYLYRWDFDPDPAYLNRSYYNSAGSVGLQSTAELIDIISDRNDLDIELVKGNTISGTLSLEAPDTFTSNGYIEITAAWGTDWNDAIYAYPDTSADQSTLDFALSIPPDAPPYSLSYYYWPAPPKYQSSGFYTATQDGFCESDATLFDASSEHLDLDFPVLKNYLIDGTVTLPVGASLVDPLPISIGTVEFPEGEQATTGRVVYRTDIEIPEAMDSANYELFVPHVCSETLTNYAVGYSHDDNNYVKRGYYNSLGTVGLAGNGELLSANQDQTTIDLQILQGQEISGTVSLPPGVVVPENGIPVNLGTFEDPDGVYHTTVTITPDNTDVSYSFKVAPDVGNVAFGYKLPTDLDIAPRGFYSTQVAAQSNITGRPDFADKLDTTVVNSGMDFTLEYGNEVSGTIYTPLPTSGYMPLEISLAADPADPDTIYWHTVLTFGPDVRSMSYSRRIVLDSDIIVSFVNPDNADWLPEGFYFDNSLSATAIEGATSLSAHTDHSQTNLYLKEIVGGDINFDGTIDLTDAILGLQMLTGMSPAKAISAGADVNGDGVLNIAEILAIFEQIDQP